MSVMLATQNPEAAARINEAPNLPPVTYWVVYHHRPMEVTRGVTKAPALVLARDPDNNVLRLLVVYSHDDMITLDRIPRRIGDERGWDYAEPHMVPGRDGDQGAMARAQAAHDRLQSFMDEIGVVLLGTATAMPKVALFDQIEELKTRLDKLEKAAPRRPRNPSEV